MDTFIISCNLEANDASRAEQLIEKIKSYQSYVCLGESVYLIKTDSVCVAIRDNLKEILTSRDKLYVGRVTSPAAWAGMTTETSEWIKEHL